MIEIILDLPHRHFAIGWEYDEPDMDAPYHTFSLYLGFITIMYHTD